MADEPKKTPEPKLPDRPLECDQCKKQITVQYTEIVGNQITHTCMCPTCPELEKRLRGAPQQEESTSEKATITGLACGNCGTTLDTVRAGSPLGCNECYEIFGDVIISELLTSKKLPTRITSHKKSTAIHIGRAPGETQEINPSMRLLALNEALRETLKREDYEQAAQLRDQIQELTDKTEEKHD